MNRINSNRVKLYFKYKRHTFPSISSHFYCPSRFSSLFGGVFVKFVGAVHCVKLVNHVHTHEIFQNSDASAIESIWLWDSWVLPHVGPTCIYIATFFASAFPYCRFLKQHVPTWLHCTSISDFLPHIVHSYINQWNRSVLLCYKWLNELMLQSWVNFVAFRPYRFLGVSKILWKTMCYTKCVS